VERASLEQKYAHLGNVRWIDLQPIEALNHLLNAADIHALPQRADAADLVLPSKLTGMMASGRPVIAAAAPGTEIANTVDGAGIVVAPGDVHAFSEAIERLAADAELRRKLGGVARERAVASMGKETILARFESELRAEVSTPT
jgi:colanic acid biosynthesis glycosyl transferase WcaI